jgi:protein-tyrosine kinase
MSIIEQAAKRLEQLRKAGVEVPMVVPPLGTPPLGTPPAAPSAARIADIGGAAPATSRHVDLDLARMAKNNLLVPGHGKYELERDFRVIKQPLLAKAIGDARIPRGNVILVTSALPGEGKTFCCINLALSMAAEIDKTVLLVDADVAKPAVPARLGVDPSDGLLDLLSRPDSHLPDLIVRTNIPKFNLLQSGRPRTNSAELLASGEMRRLVDEIAERYADRIVVLDAPPLLATVDARILAHLAGQVVMVVESGRTTRQQVSEAYAMVADCPNVTSVLNRRPGKHGAYYGGYGY